MARDSRNAGGPVTVRVSQEAEDAIRLYLEAIANPGARPARPAVDVDAIRAATSDPLEAVKAISNAIREAEAVEDPEAAFIRYAKKWAEHHNVSREAFRAMGVKPKVLAQAYGDETAPPRASSGDTARSRVSREAVASAILSRSSGERLSAGPIAAETGATVQTVRLVLDALARGGELKALGRDPNHSVKGPAPKVWERL